MKTKYRIVKSKMGGFKYYHAEVKRWWWPFWIRISDTTSVKGYVQSFIENLQK